MAEGTPVPEFPEETDDEVCTAEVFLFERQLKVSGGGGRRGGVNHWAIGVHFPHTWVHMEGDRENWILVPRYARSDNPPAGTQSRLDRRPRNSARMFTSIGSFDDPAANPPAARDIPDERIMKKAQSIVSSMGHVVPEPELESVFKVKISPLRLWHIARNHRLNNTRYFPTVNDCQVWAVEAVKAIKVFEVRG